MDKIKKILIINGSPRVGQTKRAVEIFAGYFDANYRVEIINLREMKFAPCRGCALCLWRGEAACPAKDDLALILGQMDEADAIIFASPNYALNIPGLFKNFFDRLAFVYHRPRFFNKVFSSIVTQGVYGGKGIGKYFKDTASFWGGHYLSGALLTLVSAAYTPAAPWSEKETRQAETQLSLLASRIKAELAKNAIYRPSLLRLFIFRLTRTSHKLREKHDYDYAHFEKQGWFESDYFYDVDLGPVRRIVGKIGDYAAKRSAKKK